MPGLKKILTDEGFRDADIDDGRVALVRTQFWWWNTGSGIVRQFTRPAIVPRGMPVAAGNVVEVRIAGNLAYVSRVRYPTLADGNCHYRDRNRGSAGSAARWLLGAFGVGANGAASFYCPSLEKDGWQAQKFNFGEDWFKAP